MPSERQRPWHEADPSLFQRVVKSLEIEYPTLQIAREDWGACVWGRFPARAGDDVIDWYQIEVLLYDQFPKVTPVVFEVGGRIPRDVNHHVNQTGSLCLFTPEERYKFWPPGSSFRDFLAGPVNQYFLGQYFFEQEGRWIFGDRSHGPAGPLEFYQEEFGLEDRSKLIAFVRMLARSVRPGEPCPCGSARIVNCHYRKVHELQAMIPRAVFEGTLRIIAEEEMAIARALDCLERRDSLSFRVPIPG